MIFFPYWESWKRRIRISYSVWLYNRTISRKFYIHVCLNLNPFPHIWAPFYYRYWENLTFLILMFDSVRWLNVRKSIHLLIHASGFSYNVLLYALVLLTTTIYVKKLEFCLILQSRMCLGYIWYVRLLIHILLSSIPSIF